jgi:hypothetical protein
MLKIMEESEGNVVGICASGKLAEADYKGLLPELERRFREFGKLNFLFHADETFEGWNMDAAWEDASFGFAHISDFERLALVGRARLGGVVREAERLPVQGRGAYLRGRRAGRRVELGARLIRFTR